MRMPYVIVGEARSVRDLQDAMDALVRINVGQLERYDVPRLYRAGVVYERERRGEPLPGVERFQTATDVYRLGHGDCDGLAPWLAAERIVRDGARCRAKVIPSPGIGYHVIVEHADGRIEDPSAQLGMLDGVGDTGASPTESASQRRRRRGRGLLSLAKGLLRRAVNLGARTPQGALLARAGREIAEQAEAMAERPDGVLDAPPVRQRANGGES